MIRSLYSGIGGMDNFQNKLDVIGNNIANVNTYGFKKERATFNDLVSQQMQGATGATDDRGGTNPQQVGLGGGLSSVDTIATQGSSQGTGRDLDMAISGDGYFIVNDGDEEYFTRAGNFYLDEEGTLVNANGMTVQGYGPDVDPEGAEEDFGELQVPAGETADAIGLDDGGDATLDSYSISQTGEINGVFSDGEVRSLGQIAMANFNNPEGLNKQGDNLLQPSANSGDPQYGIAGTEGRGEIQGSMLEMSNVDLAEEFAEMIVGQRGFQANTRMITTSDEILQELVNLGR
ncbi:flagellar basal body rod protein FlgG [Salisediminibacterium halotolerans]|uniref:flagellar basal body rod protein FlgG n=1 Tax=Salisediminibacterium halotolerans TaxID=517425 RepID=UPI000EB1F488|nr:flagellar basal body rod protein FlgG [Salisediminibacterium halotolerans]RLJ74214.1 flagellar hook protein FlgE [Actinophytocola xinjiangensis]RPE87693.1 flagellar hook protein FlgE [Salisediminibacterium halotolerans]TWG35051.1 flagellar hook protein FlgE [Salisediminibacterium halotolerans]GEL06662.1 flagellar basal-body rod protein FlgG [Salisediminibacterium halotolerans]